MKEKLTAAACAFAAGVFAASMMPLDGEWTLDYFPQPGDGAVRSLPLKVPYTTVKATVPGNCELDLVNAGILPPMEMGLNVLKLRPYEGYQWLYTKSFEKPEVADGQRVMLRFGGIDTLADIFINGKKIAETANMLIPYSFNVTKAIRDGENTVQVLIRSAFYETQEKSVGPLCYHMGFADNVPFRKAAHMGGWDIFPRVYVAGLWRGVSLDVEDAVRVGNVAWTTGNYEGRDGDRSRCQVRVQFRAQGPIDRFFDGTRILVAVSRGGKAVAEGEWPLHSVHNSLTMPARDVELWWPKGAGAQPLYDAEIKLVAPGGETLARDVRRIGFRTVELVRDDVYGPDRPGQFLFKVNGEPIYVRGSNWVPLDAFHGRDMQHLIPTLELFDDLNCNMVRVWGGGVYEPDEFFDFCDERGIMVWQDFMTGCSLFPQDDAYARATDEEVRCVARQFRNHASLVLWSGNNENDSSVRWGKFREVSTDPNRDRNSRRTIPDALFECDLSRPYLPSSPYVSPDVAAGKAESSEMHLWGARSYYKVPFYTNSPCWFASEMGYHGMPNKASIERMMTRGAVYPWKGSPARFETDISKLDWNDEWRLKASNPFLDPKSGLWRRNDLMTRQVKIMFGGVDTDLDTFIEQSQTVQAEAMKTFCEMFRSRKFTRFNGLIWWNVRDGWPQLSDAVVDWYDGKKPAYYALKAVQHDQLAMLGDDHVAWAVNDRRYPVKGHATYRDKASGKVLLDRDYDVAANSKARLGTIPFSGQGLIEIEYSADGEKHRNHFLYGEPPFKWAEVKEWMKDTVLWRHE